MAEDEQKLEGGNVAAQVVKVGKTVRKPVTVSTPSVTAFLGFLHNEGYPACPQHYGIDQQGRQSLEFVPGLMANAGSPLSLDDLEDIGRLIRQLHEVAVRFPVPVDALWDVPMRPDREDLICHNDLGPWNLVRSVNRWVFIDWDNSGPGSRLWDLAYAAITFPHIEPQDKNKQIVPRIRALLRGYGVLPLQGHTLPELMQKRAQAAVDLLVTGAQTGVQPWARMHEEGHATYWLSVARFVEKHSDALREACENP